MYPISQISPLHIILCPIGNHLSVAETSLSKIRRAAEIYSRNVFYNEILKLVVLKYIIILRNKYRYMSWSYITLVLSINLISVTV